MNALYRSTTQKGQLPFHHLKFTPTETQFPSEGMKKLILGQTDFSATWTSPSHKEIPCPMQILNLADNGCWPDQSFTQPSGLALAHISRLLLAGPWFMSYDTCQRGILTWFPGKDWAASENKTERQGGGTAWRLAGREVSLEDRRKHSSGHTHWLFTWQPGTTCCKSSWPSDCRLIITQQW